MMATNRFGLSSRSRQMVSGSFRLRCLMEQARRSRGAESAQEGKLAHGSLRYQVDGRGSWIRTNDLQYPKLPRYQAALYPDLWKTSSIHA